MQPSESLYDQKPEEKPVQVSTPTNIAPTASSAFTSRFEYVDNVEAAPMSSGGTHVINHVAPPKASSFFAEFGMDSGFPKKTGFNSSKVQVCYMFANFFQNSSISMLISSFLNIFKKKIVCQFGDAFPTFCW